MASAYTYLRERVTAYPDLTGSRLNREIRNLGYAGGYTMVKDFLREVRPSVPAGFEVRFETPPGRQAQVDFAHFRTVFADEPGVKRVVWLFSLVLGHSRMLWGWFADQLLVGERTVGLGHVEERDAASDRGMKEHDHHPAPVRRRAPVMV